MFEALLFVAGVTFGTVFAAGLWVVLGVLVEIATERFRRLPRTPKRDGACPP